MTTTMSQLGANHQEEIESASRKIQELSESGWELVSVARDSTHTLDASIVQSIYYFKRPKSLDYEDAMARLADILLDRLEDVSDQLAAKMIDTLSR